MKDLSPKIEELYAKHGHEYDKAERDVVVRFWKSMDLRKPPPNAAERKQQTLLFVAGRCEGLDAYKRVSGKELKPGTTTNQPNQ